MAKLTTLQKDALAKLKEKYSLLASDFFTHQHYVIITRSGIEKIAAIAGIRITYNLTVVSDRHIIVQAYGKKVVDKIVSAIETFGSAVQGKGTSGTTPTWYLAEMAEKRAMSRVVLKMETLYEMGVFGEDEADDFAKAKPEPVNKIKLNKAQFDEVYDWIADGGVKINERRDKAMAKYDFTDSQLADVNKL